MVRYSKLAFRQTVYDYGVDLCWTPMILAKEFNRSVLARDSDFTLPPHSSQIPTIIQFGASSPLEFARATSLAAPHVSGVDLNCGCPQSWACADNMGAALIHKRELVAEMIKEARGALEREGLAETRSVSVKIRIHKDLRHTLDLLQTIHSAGATFLTIHPRTRSQPSSTPASLSALHLLASHAATNLPTNSLNQTSLPIIANSDIVSLSSAHRIATETGCAGVMAARALLANPTLFDRREGYAGYDDCGCPCPWEAVEKFLAYVVRAPIPFRLVMHHLMEMVGASGGGGNQQGEGGSSGVNGLSAALLGKKERLEMGQCANMLELMDWLEGVREVRTRQEDWDRDEARG